MFLPKPCKCRVHRPQDKVQASECFSLNLVTPVFSLPPHPEFSFLLLFLPRLFKGQSPFRCFQCGLPDLEDMSQVALMQN